MEMTFTSPSTVETLTQRLLTLLNTGKEPVILPISPEPRAAIGDCFFNVEDKIRKDGGSSCLGWAILTGGAIIEAEAHAVWRSPQAELVDITPREARFRSKTIMFVEDPKLIFHGKLIDNKRLNATDNPLIDHLIRVEETIVEIQIPCTSVFKGRQEQPENIHKAVNILRKHAADLATFINSGGHLWSKCFCGRTLTYMDCHGRVEEGMWEVKEAVRTFLQNYRSPNT